MANVGTILTQKGEQFTNAHVASMSRRDAGIFVLSGCDVNQSGTPGLSVVVDSGYISVGFGLARKTVAGGTLSISAPNPTLPRIDVVYVDVNGTASIYAGTPTAISPSTESDFKKMASPSPGTNIPNGVILALVYVGANVSQILNASILDIASYGAFVAEAPTSSTTSGRVPQWSSTQRTLSTGLTVGTSASNLVQLDSSARLPAVDGSLLTGIEHTIGIYVDNKEDPIETGVKAKIWVGYPCYISMVYMHGSPSGSIQFEISKTWNTAMPALSSITGSSKPTITSDIKYSDSVLTGWDRNLTIDDWLYFDVLSCTTMTNCGIFLRVVTT